MRKEKIPKQKRLRNHSIFDKQLQRWKNGTTINKNNLLNSPQYDSHKVLDTLIFTGMTRSSLNSACKILNEQNNTSPSEETMLRIIRGIDPESMELYVNQILRDQYQNLPANNRRIFQRTGQIIIDFHTDPYYGSSDTPYIIKGKQKASTKQFFAYLTADLVSSRYSQTLAVMFRQPETSIATLVEDLLASITSIVQPKMILMDGEFAAVDLCQILINKGIQFIARKSISSRIRQHLEMELNDNDSIFNSFQSITYLNKAKTSSITLPTTCYYLHGTLKAIIKSPDCQLNASEAIKLYSTRFLIETGYRDKHKFQAQTCSRSASVRIFFFVLACILWNIWQIFLRTVIRTNKSSVRRKYQWKHRIPVIRLLWIGQTLEKWLKNTRMEVFC